MTPPTPVKSKCVYDNLPNLDSWYSCKAVKETVPCVNMKRATKKPTSNTVCFSSAPPAVYHYKDVKEQERRIVHRRNSSDHVKELFKHYTSKISRQLSR